MKGTVEFLNFARHGEANGVILQSGDFLHLTPDGMQTSRVKVGDSIVAEGAIRRMARSDQRVLEALTVNGIALNLKHSHEYSTHHE